MSEQQVHMWPQSYPSASFIMTAILFYDTKQHRREKDNPLHPIC